MRSENPVIMFARVRTTVKVIRQIDIHKHTPTHSYGVSCERPNSARTPTLSTQEKHTNEQHSKFSHMSSTSACCCCSIGA